MLLENRLNGVSDSPLGWNFHDLGHLVREIHFKDIALVSFEDVEVL